MKRWRLIFLLIIAALPFFFIDIGPGPKSAVVQLYGLAHFFFFAVVAWWLSGVFSASHHTIYQQIGLIMLIVFLGGGTIELIQPFFGRDAGWRDLGIDVLGGLFGIAFWVPGRYQIQRPVLIGIQAAVVLLAVAVFYSPAATIWDMVQAARQFPVLGDFETRLEANRWWSGVIAEGIARRGTHALEVDLGLDREKKYPGTTLRRSFGDWRGYTTFAFSIYVPDEHPLPLTVSIRDRAHFDRGGEYHDRFNRRFDLRPGWNDAAIPIADIQNAPLERKLELDDLSEVVIFTVDPPAPRRMYLDYVRLIE